MLHKTAIVINAGIDGSLIFFMFCCAIYKMIMHFSTNQSDGSDVTSAKLPGFRGGLFVAMSTDGTFQLYRWSDLAKRDGLRVAD